MTESESLYRCPSCENFFRITDWSVENDLCIPCYNEMEPSDDEDLWIYEDEDEDNCFFCNAANDCVCDSQTDWKIETDYIQELEAKDD